MKYKITSILIALVATLSVAFGANEEVPNLSFSPDGHYNLGTPSSRPGVVYAAQEVNIAGSAYRHVQVTLAAADLIAMYTTPVQIIAAQGAGKTIVVEHVAFTITRTSTAFTGGGAAIIQYDSTANGAGTQALDSTLASTVITGSAGTTVSLRKGAIISDLASTSIQNKGLFISNATAVFAAGTGTATVDVWYYVY